ncbi:hypothetical protein [Armatimonas sp.]|uniref:hypothetical protein n=1 Tax=Armatimonas sp. TaxID=1872638 RepID=UPI0037523F3C
MRFGNVAAMLIVPALILSVGCKKPSPAGTWSGSINNIPATIDIKDGGQLAVTASVMGQSVQLAGTWSAEADQLKMNLTSSTPPMVLNMLPANSRQSTNTWKQDGDSLTLTSGSTTQNLTRVK